MSTPTSLALSEALDEDLSPALEGRLGETSKVAAQALRASLLKKFRPDSSEKQDTAAIEKFLRINESCRTWSPRRDTLFIDVLLGHLKQELHRFFEPNNRGPLVAHVESILDFARVGPGASIGSTGNDFYTKLFSAELSCTSKFLEVAYTHYVSKFPEWSAAEEFRKTHGYSFDVVRGNRLSCVPKNDDISRTICIEPNLNMFYQLGLGEIIQRRLRSVFSIDLSTQPEVNRELAKGGSLGNGLCTIDLESASDSMSLSMLRHILPKTIMSWFEMLRSKTTTLPDGSEKELFMVSTMGNGFTFPLQTAIFSCIVTACLRYFGIPIYRAGERWSVFGDDIIIPLEIAGAVVDLLTYLGFTVNKQKSFFEGPFRESCGHDYYKGRNIRGVYIKSLRTTQDRVVAINLLNRWSARTGIYLRRSVRLLLKSVPKMYVPHWENIDAGIHVPSTILGIPRVSKRYQSIIYRRFVSKPKKLRVGEGYVDELKRTRRVYNPYGLLLAFVSGHVTNGEIHVRHNVNLYRSTTAVAPNWDNYVVSNNAESPFDRKVRSVSGVAPEEWQQWKTAVCVNFGH